MPHASFYLWLWEYEARGIIMIIGSHYLAYHLLLGTITAGHFCFCFWPHDVLCLKKGRNGGWLEDATEALVASSHYSCKVPGKKSRKGKFSYGIGHLLRIYVVDHRNGKSNKLAGRKYWVAGRAQKKLGKRRRKSLLWWRLLEYSA